MRSNEESVAAVKQRITEIEKQKKLRYGRMIAGAAVVVSLAIIIGISNLMPGIANEIWQDGYHNTGTAATIFGGRVVVGYAIIVLIAFVLGACVTILCHRIHLFHQDGKEAEKKQEDGDGRIC